MNPGFPLALPLGKPAGHSWSSGAPTLDEIEDRIRMVLETRPGSIPWRPEFGCDLQSLAGKPATSQRVGDARWRIQSALETWLPDLEIRHVDVRVIPIGESSASLRLPTVPVAESALMNLGMQARLEVHVDAVAPQGAVAVRTSVTP